MFNSAIKIAFSTESCSKCEAFSCLLAALDGLSFFSQTWAQHNLPWARFSAPDIFMWSSSLGCMHYIPQLKWLCGHYESWIISTELLIAPSWGSDPISSHPDSYQILLSGAWQGVSVQRTSQMLLSWARLLAVTQLSPWLSSIAMVAQSPFWLPFGSLLACILEKLHRNHHTSLHSLFLSSHSFQFLLFSSYLSNHGFIFQSWL